jgi:hypothetical protein
MLQWLASLLTAPVVNGVIEAYKARLSEKNSEGQMDGRSRRPGHRPPRCPAPQCQPEGCVSRPWTRPRPS